MTRMLFVIDSFGGDGPTRSLVALAQALHALDRPSRLDVVTLTDGAYPLTMMQARRAGADVHVAPEEPEIASLIEA